MQREQRGDTLIAKIGEKSGKHKSTASRVRRLAGVKADSMLIYYCTSVP